MLLVMLKLGGRLVVSEKLVRFVVVFSIVVLYFVYVEDLDERLVG